MTRALQKWAESGDKWMAEPIGPSQLAGEIVAAQQARHSVLAF